MKNRRVRPIRLPLGWIRLRWWHDKGTFVRIEIFIIFILTPLLPSYMRLFEERSHANCGERKFHDFLSGIWYKNWMRQHRCVTLKLLQSGQMLNQNILGEGKIGKKNSIYLAEVFLGRGWGHLCRNNFEIFGPV